MSVYVCKREGEKERDVEQGEREDTNAKRSDVVTSTQLFAPRSARYGTYRRFSFALEDDSGERSGIFLASMDTLDCWQDARLD